MTRRYESLDLCRGVACLSVVAFHASPAWFPIGWAGVPLFFVISGYCIAAAVDSSLERQHSVRTFLWRRWRRIFPPYLAMVTLTAAVAFAVPLATISQPRTLNLVQWLGNLTLTEGWRAHAVWQGGYKWWLGHAWTLGFEEQFYAVMGLLLFVLGRNWLAGAIVATVGTLAAVWAFGMEGPAVRGFFFDGHWLLFACGVAVYARQRWMLVPMIAGALWALPQWTDDSLFPSKLLIGSGFALVAWWARSYDAAVTVARWLTPLRWCGLRCYSIYLVHLTVVDLARPVIGTGVAAIPLAIGVTLLVAAPFHAYIERPCMNTRRRQKEDPMNQSDSDVKRVQATKTYQTVPVGAVGVVKEGPNADGLYAITWDSGQFSQWTVAEMVTHTRRLPPATRAQDDEPLGVIDRLRMTLGVAR